MMRPTPPVLFRADDIVPTDWTTVGTGIRRRRPRNIRVYLQLLAGPFLAAFDAGMCDWSPR